MTSPKSKSPLPGKPITPENIPWDFIPFGAQYYRAPTPHSSQWKKDLDQFKANGFNTIKYWPQWRWNNPAEGKYYFDDIDQLMDLAAERDLKVDLNVIFDEGPAWLYRKYECRMITASGQPVGPVATACRQVGGSPGPCFNHPEALEIRMNFLAETVKRYENHPALFLWDVWNEPELTVGVLRHPQTSTLVCYCEHCRTEFVEWLQSKLGGLDALNARWGRNYQTWDELELPQLTHTFIDMIDWRIFTTNVITRELQRRTEVARKFDPPSHPVMCHTVPMPIFNPVACGSDDWDLAEPGDLAGNSLGSDPFAADLITSCAQGKIAINAEIHHMAGSSLSRPEPPTMEAMKRHVLIPLAHGIKGFIFWQYRPELLGLESPNWGLTFPDGSMSPWLDAAVSLNAMLQREADFFLHAMPEGPQIGVLYNPANHIFNWCAANSYDLHDQSMRGVYQTLYANNYRVRFLHPGDLRKGLHRDPKVILYPFPYVLDREVANALRDWTQDGGTLIGEAFFGTLRMENGMHSTTVPGFGFDQVFGARERIVVPFTQRAEMYNKERDVSVLQIGPKMLTTVDLPGLAAGHEAPGYLVETPLEVNGARILAEFEKDTRSPYSGGPAITENGFGKGRAILSGTLLGYSSIRSAEASALLAALVATGDDRPRPTTRVVSPEGGKVRVDVLARGDRRAILVHNLMPHPVRAKIQLPDMEARLALVNSMTAAQVIPTSEGWEIGIETHGVELLMMD